MVAIMIGAFISGSKTAGRDKGEKPMIEDEDGYIKTIQKTTDLTLLCDILKGHIDSKSVRKQIEEMSKVDRY